MATMKQIAQLAGVSRGTVDRVLNNRGVVKEETAKKIRDIAQSLNYVPSRAAKSFAALKLGLKLGYILFTPDSNAFFKQVEEGIAKKAAELEEFHVSVDIARSDFTDHASQDKLIDDMVDKGIDGLVLCGFNTSSTVKKIHELKEKGIPVITSNTDIPDSDRLAYVGSDYFKCGRAAANLLHLMTNGKSNMGIVLGSKDVRCHEERVNGLISYLQENAPDMHIVSTVENRDDDFESFSIVKDMLAAHPEIDSLYLASAGVYGSCRAVEALPPERRPKIVSFDCTPPIATMLKKGIISATICQEPDYQGSKPLDILFNYLGMGISPSRENYYTKIDIRISESI